MLPFCLHIHNSFAKKMCYFFYLFNRDIIINIYQLHFFIILFFFSTKQINFSSLYFFHSPNQTQIKKKTKFLLSLLFFIRSWFSNFYFSKRLKTKMIKFQQRMLPLPSTVVFYTFIFYFFFYVVFYTILWVMLSKSHTCGH